MVTSLNRVARTLAIGVELFVGLLATIARSIEITLLGSKDLGYYIFRTLMFIVDKP